MSEAAELKRAEFTVLSGKHEGDKIPVHFNPVSLQYSVTNTLDEKGSGNSKKQYVSKSNGKLSLDLIFDTTDQGQDVRAITEQIARFMEPDDNQAPPVVQFEWGTYTFQGMVESYKETIDFFAPTGVPLRASVSLTISQQDKVFESTPRSRFDTQGDLAPDTVDVPASTDATRLATQSGNSRAGQAIAALNGLESMRFPSGAVTVSAAVQLSPPAAFASGSVGGGLSAGGGFGIGGSAGVSGSAGISGGVSIGGSAGVSGNAGISGGISAGASLGGSASAGVSASGGAFSGLRTAAASASPRLDPSRLIPRSQSASLATGSGASFQVGGQVQGGGSSSLTADVGVNANLQSRIQFS